MQEHVNRIVHQKIPQLFFSKEIQKATSPTVIKLEEFDKQLKFSCTGSALGYHLSHPETFLNCKSNRPWSLSTDF